MKIESTIDHTLLKPVATSEQIKVLCEEAKKFQFATVCVNPCQVKLASEQLKDCDVKVCTVVGFPLGASHSAVKAFEAKQAIACGAGEIDMVINVGAIKDKNWTLVQSDIKAVKDACGETPLKVILETCFLDNDEIIKACELSVEANAQFVKTSTGFGTAGATVEHVKLMKKTVGTKALVKASGGIRDAQSAQTMIEAGASRLGTSAGVAIANNATSHESY